MPIGKDAFDEDGREPKKKVIQGNILKILKKNPSVAISSKEFENILNARRQSINQALRALERKGRIKRGLVKEGKRYIAYARLIVIKCDVIASEGVNNKRKKED